MSTLHYGPGRRAYLHNQKVLREAGFNEREGKAIAKARVLRTAHLAEGKPGKTREEAAAYAVRQALVGEKKLKEERQKFYARLYRHARPASEVPRWIFEIRYQIEPGLNAAELLKEVEAFLDPGRMGSHFLRRQDGRVMQHAEFFFLTRRAALEASRRMAPTMLPLYEGEIRRRLPKKQKSKAAGSDSPI